MPNDGSEELNLLPLTPAHRRVIMDAMWRWAAGGNTG